MKLLTHNFLSSRFLKEVKQGYPLKLIPVKVEVLEVEYEKEFIDNIIPKCDYEALKLACDALKSVLENVPSLPEGPWKEEWKDDEELLRNIHQAMLCYEVVEGSLQCPDTGVFFKIQDGIPNLLTSHANLESEESKMESE